ncbi:MAG: M56 family metallopeptidase [Candidatus Fervidibacter sp.]|uniref:M56 family metallopeptidase n=1 Tax=Candidatus Fervidibacter sp. TaxID=3100871 RepID=UPI00404ADE3E
MKLALAAITLWFLSSALLILVVGTILWLTMKFPKVRDINSAERARLMAVSLLAPPSLGIALTVAGLTSASLCPYISARHLCLHSASHLCAHSTAMTVWKIQFLPWGIGVWIAAVGTAIVLLWRRKKAIKFSPPSAKLKRAIVLAKLPKDIPVWETEGDVSAGLIGVVSPSIFVSRQLVRDLSVPTLSAALQHEYAHFVRRDHLFRFLLFLVAFIFSPIPFTIWLHWEWQCACEEAADEAVKLNGKSAKFLSTALRTVKRLSGLEDEQLERRIGSAGRLKPFNSWASLVSATAMLFGLASGLIALHIPAIWLTLHCLAEALMIG